MTNTAIILCGGKATRLGELAKDKPKILMEIREGYTILDAQLELLYDNGIGVVILAAGHLSEKIEEYLDYLNYMNRYQDMYFHLSRENEPLGTGGAFKKAWEDCCNPDCSFVGLNGDVYCPDLDIKKMIESAETNDHIVASIAAAQYEIPFGTLSLSLDDHNGCSEIHYFLEKRPKFINAGVYYIKPPLMQFDMKRCSIEDDIFPKWGGHLMGVKYNGPWFDLGTPERLAEAREFMKAN